MYKALYRLWRPATFDEVCGQEQVTDVLRSEVISGKISHAYLFCGSRGTGKTTCAKILAKAVNCEHPVNGSPCGKCASCLSIENGTATDVYEMDAASNNGVDSIRTLRDEVVYTPSELKYRVYIVDEVHMLSQSAFNALLKTLEEPPEYVIFILATTERHKIPATILSRCQRFDFNSVTADVIVSRLETVCRGEGIAADGDALSLIAEQANGSFRDALNLLEYCAASASASGDGRVSGERARLLLGSTPLSLLKDAAVMIGKKDAAGALAMLGEIDRKRDTAVFLRELTVFFRNMLIASSSVGASDAGVSEEELAAAESAAHYYNNVELLADIDLLGDALKSASLQPRLAAELAIVKMCMNGAGAYSRAQAESRAPAAAAPKPAAVTAGKPAAEQSAKEKAPVSHVRSDEFAEEKAPLPEEPPVPEEEKEYIAHAAPEPHVGRTAAENGAGGDWARIRQELAESDASIATLIEGSRLKSGGGDYTVITSTAFYAILLDEDEYKSKIAEKLSTDKSHVRFEYLPEETPPEPIDEVIRDNT
ncbi:MAG: DNA polymerase III subunit gamma/tau [Clostridia bacterium]|nr:DNA polymerase III subunit gamma/tau [Clostridia bacterium]